MDASFGARASSSFDWETLFDGYRFDTETGTYQVRFRYLHPGLGRWLSRDPIGESRVELQFRASAFLSLNPYGGDALNLYRYGLNSPLQTVDAYGLLSLLPNDSMLACLQNCLAVKRTAPGVGSAIGHHIGEHVFFGGGMLISLGCMSGAGPIVLVPFALFGIGEWIAAGRTVEEVDDLRREARSRFAKCIMDCGRKWGEWEEAYEFWDIYQ
jgi:RHS repeat-associated protein